MRGSQVIRTLREREARGERLQRLRIISCTGNAAGEERWLRECGADDVWDKPPPSWDADDPQMQQRIAAVLLAP